MWGPDSLGRWDIRPATWVRNTLRAEVVTIGVVGRQLIPNNLGAMLAGRAEVEHALGAEHIPTLDIGSPGGIASGGFVALRVEPLGAVVTVDLVSRLNHLP